MTAHSPLHSPSSHPERPKGSLGFSTPNENKADGDRYSEKLQLVSLQLAELPARRCCNQPYR